jgi:hypothetical protein
MHTRSARNKETGTMKVEVFDYNGKLFAAGDFHNICLANDFAAASERRMMVAMNAPEALTLDEILMSDDELLAELTK